MTGPRGGAWREAVAALPEHNATGSRDFGRGYAQAIRDVLDLIEADTFTQQPMRWCQQHPICRASDSNLPECTCWCAQCADDRRRRALTWTPNITWTPSAEVAE